VGVSTVGGLSAESLHPDRAAAQDTPLHRATATATGRPVRRRIRSSALPQDVLPGAASGHAADQVSGVVFC